MIGWTSLWINGRTLMSPEINRRRALVVLGKIDEILSWEQAKEHERDERFVELGEYLCEVRAGQFPPHSGIRFPQNGCMSCSHLGLCLGNQELISANLIRKPGASELDWLDELVD